MLLYLYSVDKKISVELPGIPVESEDEFWTKMTRGCDVINGWSNSFVRLKFGNKTVAMMAEIEREYDERTEKKYQKAHNIS